MPRGPRNDAPEEIHHVWVRGLERRTIFLDPTDRCDLLDRLSSILPESGVRCFAWSLLPNHFHLVLKRDRVPLSRVMARINSGYATAFNRRHERAGFLFQNRFGSRPLEDDAELISVVRYVAFNPLKHGVCENEAELGSYPWGSYSGLRGRRPALPFETLSETRSILEGIAEDQNGRARPVVESCGAANSQEALEDWIRQISRRLGIDPREIDSSRRTRSLSDARAAISWIAVTQLGLSGANVGSRLRISRSRVSRSLARGRVVCRDLGLPPGESQQVNERPRR